MHELQKSGYKIGLITIVLLIFALAFPEKGYSQSSIVIPEGNDYATRVLGDPWDMDQFSDISQYLNNSGQSANIQNINVQNGIFSAAAVNRRTASFTVLFPGYNTAMLVGKVGERYPINSATYKCLYVAAKIDSGPPASGEIADVMQIYWFANERLNDTSKGGIVGSTYVNLYPENGANPTPAWKLHKVDLTKFTYTPWLNQSNWKGLQINPTLQKTTFAVDWVRLTDCSSVNFSISGLTTGKNYSLYLVTGGREIWIQNFQPTSSSFNADMQGVAPGTYTYRVKEGSSVVKEGPLTINQTPVVQFERPSYRSGQDFATFKGNPWDFADMSDVASVNHLAVGINNGVLDMRTEAGPGPDPWVVLNMPTHIISGSDYRYLTFRMYTEGSYQNVPQGMIARWIWRSAGKQCYMVSHDIPFDVGWQELTIDLYHAFNGAAEETSGICDGLSLNWKNSTDIDLLRFDPNENELNYPMVQKLDWIRLTRMEEVRQGTSFPIVISLNKPENGVEIQYFYTTNRSNPKMNVAVINRPASAIPGLTQGNFRIFAPIIRGGSNSASGNILWNTAGINPGEYYICAEAKDGYNTAVYCSEAPIKVVAP
jgi:hypothetical protein